MKVHVNFLSMVMLLAVSFLVAVATIEVPPSFIKSMLFISLGWVWTSFFPVFKFEPVEQKKDDDDGESNTGV